MTTKYYTRKAKFYIKSEPKRQTEANSDEERIIYKIEIV